MVGRECIKGLCEGHCPMRNLLRLRMPSGQRIVAGFGHPSSGGPHPRFYLAGTWPIESDKQPVASRLVRKSVAHLTKHSVDVSKNILCSSAVRVCNF